MSRFLPMMCLLFLPAMAGADVWDTQAQNDNTDGTENELVHGSDQLHDLGYAGTADQDWYRLSQQPYSSYEIVVDSTSGDIGSGLAVDRVAAGTSTALQSSLPAGIGFSRSLRFRNATAAAVDTERVRIMTSVCGTSCSADDVYRIRAYDTTYAIARFNNSGTQTTNVVLQNTTAASVDATLYFWDAAGALSFTHVATTLAPKSVQVINTSGLGIPVTSGSITITNTAPYGRLNGKAVSAETATGYTFDTVMTPIPH
jgi:hypothetical protein